ncbi:MAG TPA: hypothetical protein HPP90_11230 [Deltaproteobacteria bacterium]|nr:hypothetical protein [Deltaproteobacteria bacterium]
MDRKILRLLALFFFLVPLMTSCEGSSDSDEPNTATLVLNDVAKDTTVEWQNTADGPLLDVAQFMKGVGGRFLPVNMNTGIIAQYGKRIGFASNGYAYGMVQVQLCPMEPACMEDRGRLWAPLGFLAQVLDGEIEMDEEKRSVVVSAPVPLEVGDIVPESKGVAAALQKIGYTVQQGDICLSNAVEICSAGYSPNANGNNAGFPYLCIQAPLPPDAKHAILPVQFAYSLREDEGLVIIGKTPPPCDYYSYRSYFLNLCLSGSNPFERQKIYTQFGDPINSYNIQDDILYPSPGGSKVQPFESFFVLVSTPDRQLYDDVLAAVGEAGLDPNKVLLDIVDPNLIHLGNDDFADMINFLHRFSNPEDKGAGNAYVNRPTLEILRLTPNTPRAADFLAPFAPRERGSGQTEDYLMPAVDALRQAIISHYSGKYTIRELPTYIWLGKTGSEAINALEDVLGETRDTLYLNSGLFEFGKETVVVVYGVNHTAASKSVYNNVSCYGAKYFNGFGGITNDMYNATAAERFPNLSDVENIEKLYIWQFARKALDDQTFVVHQDVNRDLKGIDYDDEAFMAFRNYIDPGCPDRIGPDPDEIIFDRVMVLEPR